MRTARQRESISCGTDDVHSLGPMGIVYRLLNTPSSVMQWRGPQFRDLCCLRCDDLYWCRRCCLPR
jgi:hypothetical protein